MLPPQPVWEGNFTDWTADPFSDRNWRFQHHTLRWINPLRWSALAGDEEARDEWIRVTRSWSEHNIPAESSKSDFSWKDMADGNRAIQLSLGAPLVGQEESWFVQALEYHRDWLMDEKHIVGKNHGLHQHSGLLVVGATLRDHEAVSQAVERMRKQFVSTFDEQGANDEGSSTYHQMNMSWWATAWKRVRLEGIEPSPDVEERLALAGVVLAHIALPDGNLPQIGDAKRTKVYQGHSEFTDFVATAGTQGTAPTETTAILDRGYIISRSGWGKDKPLREESHALIRFGEDTRSHSHQDRGSVHIYSAGQNWLIDPGFHSYQPGLPEVQYLKSREAHNVASLIGADHDDSAVVELVTSDITDDYHDFVLSDRGFGGDEVTRRVVYLTGADCWIVLDSTNSDRPLRQRWNVEVGVSSQMNDFGYRLTSKGKSFNVQWIGRNVKFSRHKASEDSFAGWIGTGWKTMNPSQRLDATATGGRKQIVALLGSHHPHPLALIDSRVSGSGSVRLRISRGSNSWSIQIGSKLIVKPL